VTVNCDKVSGISCDATVVTGLLIGHNTLRRHINVMGLSNNPTCRKCGTEEETSVHVWCECEALASLSRAHLGHFFLDLENIMNLRTGGIWNCGKGTGIL
jgi:hypothetical protein